MKLTSAQVKHTANQLDAQAVPDDGELVPELQKLFGDHTFFLSSTGLHIVDPTESEDTVGRVVRLARWTDSHRKTLAPHDPEFTGVLVALDKAA